MAHPAQRLTEDEYLAQEREAGAKHEYVAGVAYAMSGATPRHNLAAMNLGAALRDRLRARPSIIGSPTPVPPVRVLTIGSPAPGASVRALRTLPYAPSASEHSC